MVFSWFACGARRLGPENVVTQSVEFLRIIFLFSLVLPYHSRDTTVMYVRTIKVPSSNGTINEYVRVVEAYRDGGKVKQRTIADLGRKDILAAMLPKLQRLLRGDQAAPAGEAAEVDVLEAATWGPVLVVRRLFEQLGLWQILDALLGRTKDVPAADRAFVLIANRLIAPHSEHGLACWLETDFVCDRQGRRFVPQWQRRGRVKVDFRQLDSWYRTLDRLLRAKEEIEVQLYYRLRDLFSLQPDLVLYDVTSTYFEGAGPKDFAKHGYSRDGKPHNVQVIVGLVMVAGWPIAHHVWEGNRLDVTTVPEVVRDLTQRFAFRRVIFVGDRGMVSQNNLDELQQAGHGYLLALKRRRNAELDAWLQKLDETKWQECPVGINAQEKKTNRPRTRVQEVDSGDTAQRVFVIDSDERRCYEQSKRAQAMERTRLKLESVQRRVAEGKLTKPEAIGAAAERALRAHHGYRYYAWEIRDGGFVYFEHPVHLEREQRLEGKYVIATSEQDMEAQDAVAWYKELLEVEQSFRQVKDVLALRPIYHRVEPRVRAHIFVAALALLVQRLLQRRLEEADVEMSATEALEAVSCVRQVTFQVNDGQRSGVSAGSARAQQVLRALGISELRPPTPPRGQATVV
jgi:transposase